MNAAAVGVGGFFGALARYLIGTFIPVTNGFPFGTLLANLLGCFFLAWFLTAAVNRWRLIPQLKLAIGTGFTGSFTTFSTFSVETLHLLANHHFPTAFFYVAISILGGLALAVLGVKIAVSGAAEAMEGSDR